MIWDLKFVTFLQHKKFIESLSFFLSKYLKTKTKDKQMNVEVANELGYRHLIMK